MQLFDRHRLAATLAAALLAPAAAPAQSAPGGTLGLGFYAPELAADPYQRFAYVQGLALQLERRLGRPVRGQAYKHARRLQQDLRARRLHVAVLGGLHVAAQRPGPILATGRLASPQISRWSLMGRQRRPLGALRRETLQLPNLGRLVFGLVERGLLGGNIKLRSHFRVVLSPDQRSAEQAVRVGAAAAVFAPVGAQGLTPLIERAVVVPAPALVLLDRSLPEALVSAITRAVTESRATLGALSGWGPAEPQAYEALAASAQRGGARMILVPTRAPCPPARALIDAAAIQYEYPDLSDLFVVP